MGFEYFDKFKALSINEIFAKINNRGGEDIDKDECSNAPNISIFVEFKDNKKISMNLKDFGFVVREGMNLDDFERENLDAYAKYEEKATNQWAEAVFKFFGHKDTNEETNRALNAKLEIREHRKERWEQNHLNQQLDEQE